MTDTPEKVATCGHFAERVRMLTAQNPVRALTLGKPHKRGVSGTQGEGTANDAAGTHSHNDVTTHPREAADMSDDLRIAGNLLREAERVLGHAIEESMVSVDCGGCADAQVRIDELVLQHHRTSAAILDLREQNRAFRRDNKALREQIAGYDQLCAELHDQLAAVIDGQSAPGRASDESRAQDESKFHQGVLIRENAAEPTIGCGHAWRFIEGDPDRRIAPHHQCLYCHDILPAPFAPLAERRAA